MTANDQTGPVRSAVTQRARKYRISGAIIFVFGLAAAGVVYWLGTRGPDYSDDPAMAGFNRAEKRQMGLLYGKQGQFYEDLSDALKQPGTQAILIVAAAGVMGAGCFYFARVLAAEADSATGSPPG